MSKRLVVFGATELLESIRAVWAGQGLRFELEDIEPMEQPKEEVSIDDVPAELIVAAGITPEEVKAEVTKEIEAETEPTDGLDADAGEEDEAEDDVKETPATPKRGRKPKGKK